MTNHLIRNYATAFNPPLPNPQFSSGINIRVEQVMRQTVAFSTAPLDCSSQSA